MQAKLLSNQPDILHLVWMLVHAHRTDREKEYLIVGGHSLNHFFSECSSYSWCSNQHCWLDCLIMKNKTVQWLRKICSKGSALLSTHEWRKGWGRGKKKGRERDSHINSIHEGVDWLVFMSPGLFKMLEWFQPGTDDQSLQMNFLRNENWWKETTLYIRQKRIRSAITTFESTSQTFLRVSSTGAFVCNE